MKKRAERVFRPYEGWEDDLFNCPELFEGVVFPARLRQTVAEVIGVKAGMVNALGGSWNESNKG